LTQFHASHKILDMKTDEDIDTKNACTKHKALQRLGHIIDKALAEGVAGCVSVRIPIQRGKLGNIREILERESA